VVEESKFLGIDRGDLAGSKVAKILLSKSRDHHHNGTNSPRIS